MELPIIQVVFLIATVPLDMVFMIIVVNVVAVQNKMNVMYVMEMVPYLNVVVQI